jgi:exonuclease VII small subunit
VTDASLPGPLLFKEEAAHFQQMEMLRQLEETLRRLKKSLRRLEESLRRWKETR